MHRTVKQQGTDSDRLSFTNALKILRCRLPECPKSKRGLQAWYRNLIDEIGEEINEPRRNRINPRVIKKKKKQREHRHCPQPSKGFRESFVMLN